jgi:hypothetical protein
VSFNQAALTESSEIAVSISELRDRAVQDIEDVFSMNHDKLTISKQSNGC